MRLRMIGFVAAVVAAIALAACGGSSPTTSSSSSTTTTTTTTSTSSAASVAQGSPNGLSYEGIPLQVGPFIAPADTTGTTPVDGIKCAPVEQLAYHIHAHLSVFDDGRLYALPAGIGIPGSSTVQTSEGPVATGGHCFYWLHTHTSDGVIHIESPTQRIYTLGQFFDEWHQPLTANGSAPCTARSPRTSTASRGRRASARSRCCRTPRSSSTSASRRRR